MAEIPRTTASERAKRQPGYAKAKHDLITASECVALVEHRVAVLLAHYEAERRRNVWYRQLWHRIQMLVAERPGRR